MAQYSQTSGLLTGWQGRNRQAAGIYLIRLSVRPYPDDSIAIGYCRLPAPPFEIIFENHLGCLGRKISSVHINNMQLQHGDGELIFRSIPVNAVFTQETEDKFYVERVDTGRFNDCRAYSVLREDFRNIESSFAGFRGHEAESRLLKLQLRIGDEERSQTFDYDKHTKCLESFLYISPEAALSDFRLVDVFGPESGVV
ncbi:MAG: hypothetical protein AB2L14_12560 [Candidatus Xenobiia bacterium LiM19]